MNNQKTKKVAYILELIEKDFKVTNFTIYNERVTIAFELNGDDDNGKM